MTNEELLAAINARFDAIDARFNSIQEQLDDLKEDCEVTRDGVNTLLEWADTVG